MKVKVVIGSGPQYWSDRDNVFSNKKKKIAPPMITSNLTEVREVTEVTEVFFE